VHDADDRLAGLLRGEPLDRAGDDLAGADLALILGLPFDVADDAVRVPLRLRFDARGQLGLGLLGGQVRDAFEDALPLGLQVADLGVLAVQLGQVRRQLGLPLLQLLDLLVQPCLAFAQPVFAAFQLRALLAQILADRLRLALELIGLRLCLGPQLRGAQLGGLGLRLGLRADRFGLGLGLSAHRVRRGGGLDGPAFGQRQPDPGEQSGDEKPDRGQAHGCGNRHRPLPSTSARSRARHSQRIEGIASAKAVRQPAPTRKGGADGARTARPEPGSPDGAAAVLPRLLLLSAPSSVGCQVYAGPPTGVRCLVTNGRTVRSLL
jgi:hypothetical protein